MSNTKQRLTRITDSLASIDGELREIANKFVVGTVEREAVVLAAINLRSVSETLDLIETANETREEPQR